ncbi:Aerobic glycerol-3-phosphate dehydrogenase [hydrothermal vent metagenome]|uniref:Aerobic glycerol-3-phosphate dehydrogenase n=1 Tax=hydrothermal vent metagenome TaxID=652676 RepID=A0A3B1BHM1_9ZZZZ
MNPDYDILIIGGGIQGAGCAQAAAAAGYSVVVLEQYDRPGLGTSCKSSKLIHGGLRYLETAQFRLVYECLQERQLLLHNAPHLVTLEPFYIPVYKHSIRKPWLIRLGLTLYTLLSGKGFASIPKHQWDNLDGLKTNDLLAVFKYYDGRTDDQRLTASVMQSAQQLGAKFISCAKFTAAECKPDLCTTSYQLNDENQQLSSRVIINASGPWANLVLQKVKPQPAIAGMDLVLGTHIIISGVLAQGMYYVEAPQDQRAVFVMPWHEGIMIGTTEILFDQSPNHVEPPESDIEYLIDVYNHYFANTITRKDVTRAFAGLRVLPADSGSAFTRSREIMIHNDQTNPQVFTVYGGKLTAYRATGERTIKLIQKMLPKRDKKTDVRSLRLP